MVWVRSASHDFAHHPQDGTNAHLEIARDAADTWTLDGKVQVRLIVRQRSATQRTPSHVASHSYRIASKGLQ
jgi:hypothetical protein